MALTPEQLAYADQILEARVIRANGQVYQDLFVQIMSLRYKEFRTVKPHGAAGDRKNDGYRPSDGIYYQAYAPENPDAKVTEAIKKLQTDFEGLLAFWNDSSPVKEFYFVYNDKFGGVYPDIEKAMLELKKKHGLSECRPFLNADLMREVRELDERQLRGLVGQLPSSESIADLDYSVFTGVLSHLISSEGILTPEVLLRVPDFVDKIEFNQISSGVAALLTAGNLQSGAVEAFFSSHGAFSKTAVRDKLAQLYADCRSVATEQKTGNKLRGDVIFFLLLDRLAPPPRSKAVQDASIVLFGYFFETCDIYEDPNLV